MILGFEQWQNMELRSEHAEDSGRMGAKLLGLVTKRDCDFIEDIVSAHVASNVALVLHNSPKAAR